MTCSAGLFFFFKDNELDEAEEDEEEDEDDSELFFSFFRKREVNGDKVEVREEELKTELREDIGLVSSPTAVLLEEREVRASGKAEP